MVAVNSGLTPLSVPNGAVPCEGTKAFPFKLDFTVGNAYVIDMTQSYLNKQFSTLQCVYIDNSDNASDLDIICNATDQRVSCPAGSQGYFPLLAPSPPKFVVQTSGSLLLEIIFLNFYIPPGLWANAPASAGGLPQVDIPAIDAIISGGAMNVNAIPTTSAVITDASSTITTGGTPKSILAPNPARKRFILANPDTATETLYFMFNVGTAGRIPLKAGERWDESGSEICGAEIFAVAVTSAHPYTLYWF